MLKQKTTLEIAKEEKIYQFICDPYSNVGEIYDVLTQMKSYVYNIIREEEEKIQKSEKSLTQE